MSNLPQLPLDRSSRLAAERVLTDVVRNGGGTYDQGTLLPFEPKVGYAVGIGGIKLPAQLVTPDSVLWAAKIASREFDAPYVGAWMQNGQVHFDAVRYFGPHARADAIAAGEAAGQQAIYDFAERKDITL